MRDENNITETVDPNTECQRFNDVFRQSPISIEIYGADGKLEDVNQACLDLYGIESVDEIRGVNLFTNPNLNQQSATSGQ
jgi:PAS domain-containing protein